MDSVRKGLRAGDLEKDTYERLRCSACEQTLKTKNDPDDGRQVRSCPVCGSEWRRIG
jgi:rRNA maturation endonuclease Nob1